VEQLAAQSSHERLRDDSRCSAARRECLTGQRKHSRSNDVARDACAPYARAAFLFILLSIFFAFASHTPAQSGRRRPEPTSSPAPNTQRPRRATPTRPAEDVPGQPATPDAPSTATPTPAPANPTNNAPRPQANEPATATAPVTASTSDDASVEIDEGDVVRVTSNLVPVSATVTDTRGKAVTDLTVDDFELRVDGQPKPIGGLSHAETPVRMVMLFDNSKSIRASREFEKQAAIRFFKNVLRPIDQAAIYSVETVFSLEQPLTNDVSKLVRTIERFPEPDGATKLLDAMAHAADYLRLLPGRKVVVIVSDGTDTVSDLGFDETLRRVLAADCQVYSVQTGTFENANLIDLMAVRRLETFSDRTGGAVYTPKTTGELDAAFAQIAADLSQQYVLSYYPTDEGRDGRYRVISLRVKTRPNLRVRARRGYYPRINAQQLSSSQPERFVNASDTSGSSVSGASPSDEPLDKTRELASNATRSTIKLGGPAHGSKNMNPDTSGDATARAETDVRVSPTVKPSETGATKAETKVESRTSQQSNGSPPSAELKSESPPEPKPTPDAEPSREASNEPKPTPTPATTPTPTTAIAPLQKTETTSPQPSTPASQQPPPAQDAPKPPTNVGQLNSKALSLPRPVYPETARRMKVEGAVRVLVTIDASGKVVSARADGGPVLLREAAVAAARQARFTPALVSGQPAPVSGFITYNFSL
jgi:Ca-activated chloride channel family protein